MRSRAVQWAGALLVLGASGFALWDAAGPDVGMYPHGFVYEAAVPVVVALLPQMVRRRRVYVGASWAAAALLVVLCFLTLFSVGIFYVPGALLLVAGAALASCGPTPSRSP